VKAEGRSRHSLPLNPAPSTVATNERDHKTVPSYHCILNVAELVWNAVKTRLGQKMSLKITSEIENLITRVSESSNEEDWKNVSHAKKIKAEY
jgi:hypothetical protein